MVAYPARVQMSRENESSPPSAPEKLVSRDRFGRHVPRKPAYSPHLAIIVGWIWCLFTGFSPSYRFLRYIYYIIIYTIYYILYTIHYILYIIYTIYYILYTIYCIYYIIIYTIYYILYTIHYIVYILYTIYYILYILYTIIETIHTVKRQSIQKSCCIFFNKKFSPA